MSLAKAVPLTRQRLDLWAVLLLTGMCALWGLQQVAIKVALQEGLPPALQAGLRSVLSALCLGAWTGWRGGMPALRRMFMPDALLLPGMLMGVVFAVEFLLLFFGTARTSASRGVLFLYTSPFFVAIGVHLFVPGERLGLRQVIGLVCAFSGVAAAVLDGLRGSGGNLLGDAMVTGTAILWAGLTVSFRAVPLLRRTAPARILMFQLSFSSFLLLGFAAWLGELPALGQASSFAYAILAYQSVVVAFATYLTWYWLLSIYPSSKVSAFSFLTPIFGIMSGALLMHDRLSPALMLALILVAGGLFLINSRK